MFKKTLYKEKPEVRVDVAGFWMSATEMTNADFAAFVAATGYITLAEQSPDPNNYPGIPVDQLKPGDWSSLTPHRLAISPSGGNSSKGRTGETHMDQRVISNFFLGLHRRGIEIFRKDPYTLQEAE